MILILQRHVALLSTLTLLVSSLGGPHYLGTYYPKSLLLGGGRGSQNQHSTKAKALFSSPFPLFY